MQVLSGLCGHLQLFRVHVGHRCYFLCPATCFLSELVREETGVIELPVLGEDQTLQMYVHFEGFPINNSAFFELVSYLMTPVRVAK